ncbi:hypothetical protein SELMODRAFT_86151 [Selaginella moellendorffii]|uniref:Reticulon-like protein n=1 Tax=Selaginella moellendorffii TaxID=88036 RepID=D8R602_SELML|nr:reticulon-like protein B2 [Selaginella moellendorffii]EFJ32575.1 hypothetical protein SELMODRAFT_86151 [Selaginella moellendorffii]|eukprot:XP_002966548.1 reticulon-like protein B2 [Selaginella moellendorffii]
MAEHPAGEHQPPSPAPPALVAAAVPHPLGTQRSVHEILGGGKYADVLMWKKKHVTGGILLGATVSYVLFEWCGYTLLSIASNALLFLVLILFTWSNLAALLDKPPPPIPEIQLSEEMVENIAQTLRLELNRALGIIHMIALGKDFMLCVEVIAGLWIFSLVGGWCHFLTLLYFAVVLAHTLPLIYDKYEDGIDKYLEIVTAHLKSQTSRRQISPLQNSPS